MTTKLVRIETEVEKAKSDVIRWRSTCPVCGYFSVRAKREAAVHVVSQHVAYEHGLEVAP